MTFSCLPFTTFGVIFLTLQILHQGNSMCTLNGNPFRRTELFDLRFSAYTLSASSQTLNDCVSLCDSNLCISFGYNYLTAVCYLYDRRVLFGEDSAVFEDGMVNYWTVAESCPGDYTFTSTTNLCYKLVYTKLNHSMANNVCAADGGHLLILDSPTKRTYFFSEHGYDPPRT
ncbi:hypothetical protein LOTGIDRAFT_176296 [Lottia gigantea]|uniref:Apple domain-containing protein n=1 Tax=Lottia gigantea TaxID=225164 RepID=V3ZE05_LOTGI|nr:hypothetical protein LOTGIDRAFT_176296 [Lottia gigantea]ESO82292.1 hypothetical protein LOTGIDRAFT_176296 [Lottia gigantea]